MILSDLKGYFGYLPSYDPEELKGKKGKGPYTWYSASS